MVTLCVAYDAPLELEDSHDKCPSCLAVEHLRQGLTELAYMSFMCMILCVQKARLAIFKIGITAELSASQRDSVLSLNS